VGVPAVVFLIALAEETSSYRLPRWWVGVPWVKPEMPAGTKKVSCKDGKGSMESSDTGDSSQKTCLLDTWPRLAPLEIK